MEAVKRIDYHKRFLRYDGPANALDAELDELIDVALESLTGKEVAAKLDTVALMVRLTHCIDISDYDE